MGLAFRIVTLGETDSTNRALKERAAAGEAEGLVLIAERQSAGRGRRGRGWDSPPGNLYASLLLRPRLPLRRAATLSFAAALAVKDSVQPLLAAPVRLKWPNDVLVGGRKLSGILLECGSKASGGIDWLVLGVGINLVSHPQPSLYPATDLVAAGGPSLAPAAALALWLKAFAPLYAAWIDDFAPIRERWLEGAEGIGRAIVADLGGERVEGILRGIDAEGSLLLDLAGEGMRRIAAADIIFQEAPDEARHAARD